MIKCVKVKSLQTAYDRNGCCKHVTRLTRYKNNKCAENKWNGYCTKVSGVAAKYEITGVSFLCLKQTAPELYNHNQVVADEVPSTCGSQARISLGLVNDCALHAPYLNNKSLVPLLV